MDRRTKPTLRMSPAELVADQATLAPGAKPATATPCAHCGLPVPLGLIDSSSDTQFCCGGCRTVYEILHEHGLDQYYRLPERREEPVRASGRTYEEFDHPAFRDLYVRPLPGGLAQVELYLEGVHCGSCVWLVERVPLIIEGVARTELEIRRSRARVVWNPAGVPLSRIARTLDSLGYPPHPFRGVQRDALRRREDRAMLVRIGVAGAVAVNVMLAALALYSGTLGGMDREFERFFRWISLAVVTPAMIWPARVFFAGAWSALRTRTLHMDVPIAVGLAAGYVRGAINTVQDSGPIYFDGLATLTFALLVGRYLQQRGQRAAADGAELLYSLTPSTARVVEGDGEAHELPAEALTPGMILEVRPGDTIAADGVVSDGQSQLDLSLLTGESHPVATVEGDRVYAGTVNLSSPLRVRVDHTGEESRIGKILRQVDESARRRAPIVETANRLAAYFVAAVLVAAVLTFAVWQRIDPARAVDNAIALLVVTCPCALALSTPLAVSVAIGRAARLGIFVKGGDALERLSRPGRIFLDKTGTITEGRMALVSWVGPEWVKPLVLALEKDSSHPIAGAFRGAWPSLAVPRAAGAHHVAGGGITGTVDGRNVVVGSRRFVRRHLGASAAEPLATRQTVDRALTPVLIAVDGEIVATAGIGDPLRPDAKTAIQRLRTLGWRVEILSGDARSVVSSVGQSLGLDQNECIGGASPEEKLAAVDGAARARGPVVMVGDGINDAAAIAAASVGVGVHGGAEACLSTADVYLTTPGLAPLVHLITGARRTMTIIRRNIAFSLVYNVIGGGLAIAGVLTPLVAAILMPASSLTVILASWRGAAFRDGVS